MKKLNEQAGKMAQEKAAARLHEVKSELRSALPDHVRITEQDGNLTIRSSRLQQDIIHHAALRDVAFLMRGVR